METINSAAWQLAYGYGINPAFLEFIGIQDETETVGKKFYLFNVMDPAHMTYKSTIAFRVIVKH